jgi:hypothetical protein
MLCHLYDESFVYAMSLTIPQAKGGDVAEKKTCNLQQ